MFDQSKQFEQVSALKLEKSLNSRNAVPTQDLETSSGSNSKSGRKIRNQILRTSGHLLINLGKSLNNQVKTQTS